MTKHIGCISLVIFLLSTTACKTKRATENITIPPGSRIETPQALFKKIDSLGHTYSNLNIRYAAEIKIGKDQNSVRGKLKIRKDSCVWVSALPLGIEAARIIATQTEAGLINYLKRNYFLGDYGFLGAQLGYDVNYDMLQSILTGSPLFLEDRSAYLLLIDHDEYYLSPIEKDRFEKITEGKEPADRPNVQALWFFGNNYTLSKNVLYDAVQQRYLEITYSDYQPVGNNLIPFRINIQIKTPKDTGTFSVEYTRVDPDQSDMEYPFTVPASYTKMEVKQ